MNTTTLLNNRYKVIESIGRGGFGETFLAVDTHSPSGKRCVIKQLKPIINESSIPEWMYDRFEQEARILEHVGDEQNQVPRLHAYFCEDQNFYLVQEWVEGITLTKKIQQEGKMSPEEVEKFLLNILPVLGYIHRENIVHRDVKPDNIILRAKDNLPVLIDFGAVKEALTTFVYSQGQSAYSMAIGTPGYMSSEQAAGRPIYSSDLYSLGLTAVYLLTGKSPQHLRSDNRTGEILWRDEIPDLHSNLAGVIDKTIRFSPRERFSSASEMLEALKPNTSHQPTVGFGSPVIPNYTSPPAQTISNEPTIAVGGRYGNPNIVNNSSGGTIRQGNGSTVAVDSPTEGYEEEEEKRGFFGALLPILWLSLIAIASFTLGYGVIANLFNNSNGQFANESGQNQAPETSEEVEPPTIESNRRNPIFNSDIFRRPETEEEVIEEEIPPDESVNDQNNESEVSENQTPPQDTTNQDISGNDSNNTSGSSNPSIDNSSGQGRGDNPPRGNSGRGNNNSLPVLTTGNVVNEIVSRLGQPSQRQSNPSENATVWSYDNIFNSTAQVSYKIDDSSGRIREVDLSFPNSTDMETMAATFDRLLRGNLTPVVREALRQVNDGETDLRSFSVANWNGQIRKIDGRININVWLME